MLSPIHSMMQKISSALEWVFQKERNDPEPMTFWLHYAALFTIWETGHLL
jgi:hypothetical protein